MTSPAELYQYGNPGQIGRVAGADWHAIERSRRPLPEDYKALISGFGLGSFGDLILFHPHHKNQMFHLSRGEELGRQMLSEHGNRFLEKSIDILGYVSPRRYLVRDTGQWTIVDSETGRVDEIGEDLVAFIRDAYTSLRIPGPHASLAQTIWKLSSDGTRTPFFLPQRARTIA